MHRVRVARACATCVHFMIVLRAMMTESRMTEGQGRSPRRRKPKPPVARRPRTARVSDAPRSEATDTSARLAARGRGRRDEPRPKRVARVRHLRARLAYPSRPRRRPAACRPRGTNARRLLSGVFPSRSSRSSAPRRLPPPPSTPSTRGTAGTPRPRPLPEARRSLCAPLLGTRPARSAWRGTAAARVARVFRSRDAARRAILDEDHPERFRARFEEPTSLAAEARGIRRARRPCPNDAPTTTRARTRRPPSRAVVRRETRGDSGEKRV